MMQSDPASARVDASERVQSAESDPLGPAVLRLLIPVVVSLVVQVPATAISMERHGVSSGTLLALVAAAAGPLALLGARRWPGPVVAIASVMAMAGIVLAPAVGPGSGPGLGTPPVALVFATAIAIVRGARVWALVSLAVTWTVVLTLLIAGDVVASPRRLGLLGVAMLIAVGAGEFVRSRRDRLDRERRTQAELIREAGQSERVRMARELHDVLAHSLSSINVQAAVGLHLLDSQPQRAGEALAAIKIASKNALDEVRGVIGVLRDVGDAPRRPVPGLDDIGALADPLRAAGIGVQSDIRVPEETGAAVQLALYRIAQESLTNVLRHSQAAHVRVSATGTPTGSVELIIVDDGPRSGVPVPGGGLTGMAERAALLGGVLDAGPGADGGFRVHAVIPGGNE